MGDLVALVGLALLDSLSLGTLVIPVALVVSRRRVDVGPLAIYFATVVGIYLALGVALVLGIEALTGPFLRAFDTEPAQWAKLVLGVVLVVVGVLSPTPKTRTGPRPEPRSLAPAAMVALGAGAALTEAATMVPYLAGTAIIAGMGAAWGIKLLVLAGYCLVMVLPALLLIALAGAVGGRIWPRLERWVPVLEREAKTTLLWIAAIAGFWLTWSAWAALFGAPGAPDPSVSPRPAEQPDARPDLVERRFAAQRPNQLWVADMTYVRIPTGFCYVAFITDVHSRKIVG